MPENENKSNSRKIYHFPRVRKRTENWQVKEIVVEPVAAKDTMPKFQGFKLNPGSSKHKSILIEAGIVGAIALITIFLIPPLLTIVGQAFRVSLLGRFLALAIVALGIDLIWGYTGMLSLGHGVFFALGGYALAMHLQLAPLEPGRLPEFMGLYGVQELPWFWQPFYSFPLTIIGVIIIPALLAALLGYLVFRNRIRGVYFSILTQAATIVFFNFFNGQQKLFNGTNGLTNYKTLLGFEVNAPQTQFTFYALTIILLALTYGFCRWLTTGRFGRLLVAIRDDESRVRFSGYNPTGFKVLVFAISAGLAGIAGALYTIQTGLISPKAMDIAFSIEMVIWVAVGGRATLIGAIIGAILVNFARSLLSEQFPEIWLFFQGALFLLVVMLLPDGLVGWWRSQGINQIRRLLRMPNQAVTYPSLETDPEVQQEREELTGK
jgi:urea transport system permease protein